MAEPGIINRLAARKMFTPLKDSSLTSSYSQGQLDLYWLLFQGSKQSGKASLLGLLAATRSTSGGHSRVERDDKACTLALMFHLPCLQIHNLVKSVLWIMRE